jgi:hypothetical protein
MAAMAEKNGHVCSSTFHCCHKMIKYLRYVGTSFPQQFIFDNLSLCDAEMFHL